MNSLDGLNVWNRSCDLAIRTYRTLNACLDPNFRAQMTRASLSVATNIAAGYERNSRRQFCRYLKTASGSCAELRTQLYIAAELGIIDDEQSTGLIAESLEISTMLQGLIASVRKRNQTSA